MTSRERVMAALNRREPDRLPLDIGSARVTGMVKGAYERLCGRLGFGASDTITDRMQQLVEMDEAVLEHLGVDVRAFAHGAPDTGGDQELPDGRVRDEWGVVRSKPEGFITMSWLKALWPARSVLPASRATPGRTPRIRGGSAASATKRLPFAPPAAR